MINAVKKKNLVKFNVKTFKITKKNILQDFYLKN